MRGIIYLAALTFGLAFFAADTQAKDQPSHGGITITRPADTSSPKPQAAKTQSTSNIMKTKHDTVKNTISNAH